MGGIGIWQLLIVLLIVVMLFGTKRLRGLGGDLGSALKGFRKAMGNEEAGDDKTAQDPQKLQKKEGADATFSESASSESTGSESANKRDDSKPL